jgi:alpha-1,2-glucosyltransferase
MVKDGPVADEYYHVRQAIQYCEGGYSEWDPMITTPPGLYFWSWILLRPLRMLGFDVCTLGWMRATTALAYLLILVTLRERRSLAFMPILTPYAVLYYTDTLGLLLILVMIKLARQSKNVLAASVGLMAVCVRQTNIAWVAYAGWEALLNKYMMGRSHIEGRVSDATSSEPSIRTMIRDDWREYKYVILPYAIVMVLFVIFAIQNGGISLGDKGNHKVTIHLMQLEYLAITVFIMAIPLVSLRRPSIKPWLLTICSIPLHYLIIKLGTVRHPYLLAEDCHLTGWIWRHFYNNDDINVILHAAFFAMIWFSLYASISPSITSSRKLSLLVALMIATIPLPLLEPRYFIVPTILYGEMHSVPRWKAVLYYGSMSIMMYTMLLAFPCEKTSVEHARHVML